MKSPLILTVVLALALCAPAKDKDKPKHERNNVALKDDLVGYWNMAQNAALDFPVHDFAGENHLTPHGSPVLVDGKLGKAIEFDGSTQWLDIASNAGLNHNEGEFTGMIWFKPLTLNHGELLVGSVDWGVTIVQSGANYYVNVGIEEGAILLTDVPLVENQWYCLFFGWYNSNGSFAWGSLNLSQRVREFRTVWSDPQGPFKIAGTSSGSRVHAVIDETAIWRRNVPAHELYRIYNRGNGLPFEQWDAAKPCKEIICCD